MWPWLQHHWAIVPLIFVVRFIARDHERPVRWWHWVFWIAMAFYLNSTYFEIREMGGLNPWARKHWVMAIILGFNLFGAIQKIFKMVSERIRLYKMPKDQRPKASPPGKFRMSYYRMRERFTGVDHEGVKRISRYNRGDPL